MVSIHTNDDGERLKCSTTPEDCIFQKNAGHIDEYSSFQEVEEFNRRSEKIAQKAAKRKNKNVTQLGTVKRVKKRPNNNNPIELDDYTPEELHEREVSQDRMALKHNDIFEIEKRNNGSFKRSAGRKESTVAAAKAEYEAREAAYQKRIDENPKFDEDNMDNDDISAYRHREKAKRDYEKAQKDYAASRTEYDEEVKQRKERHLDRLFDGTVEPLYDYEHTAVRDYKNPGK